MGINFSLLPKNNGNLPLPFFCSSYPIVLLDNIYWYIVHLDSPTPANRQHLLFVSEHRTACLLLHPCPAFVRPPFADLGLCPGPCQSLGVAPVAGPSISLMYSPSPSLCDPPSPVIFWCLVSNWGGSFCVRKRGGAGASTLWAVACPRSSPPPTCHGWDLPVLHYHKIMVIYPYPFLVVVTQLFSWIIFINDCIWILTGSPG